MTLRKGYSTIYTNPSVVFALGEQLPEISEALHTGREMDFTLSETLHAETKKYKERMFVALTRWCSPTKNGTPKPTNSRIFLKLDELHNLILRRQQVRILQRERKPTTYANTIQLGVRAYANALRETMIMHRRLHCENSYDSVKGTSEPGHSCWTCAGTQSPAESRELADELFSDVSLEHFRGKFVQLTRAITVGIPDWMVCMRSFSNQKTVKFVSLPPPNVKCPII